MGDLLPPLPRMWSKLVGIVLAFSSVARYADATSSTSSLQSAADLEAERLKFSKRIIGGGAAKEDEFRFLLHLRPCENKNSCYLCGGTIIAKDWILTAAHCVTPIKNTSIFTCTLESTKSGTRVTM